MAAKDKRNKNLPVGGTESSPLQHLVALETYHALGLEDMYHSSPTSRLNVAPATDHHNDDATLPAAGTLAPSTPTARTPASAALPTQTASSTQVARAVTAREIAANPQSNDMAASEYAAANKARQLADRAKDLAELRDIVMNFNDCPLKAGATNTVFSDGNPAAKVMLIGEAPGANEDLQGIPFCGQSGKLLDNILRAIGLDRSKAYITNTVFWRPPNNRRPTQAELAVCRPFVEKHVALIRPELLLLVGSTAAESLLGLTASMGELRKLSWQYSNKYLTALSGEQSRADINEAGSSIRTAVIFHPSYLLRQPTSKKLMWFDLLRIANTVAPSQSLFPAFDQGKFHNNIG